METPPAKQSPCTILAFALVELVGPFYLIALGERWVSSSLAGILLAGVATGGSSSGHEPAVAGRHPATAGEVNG